MKKILLGILFLTFTLNADIVMCTGYQSMKSIENTLESKQDISHMNFRLNTTNERATVIMGSDINNYYYVREGTCVVKQELVKIMGMGICVEMYDFK